jgi:uncharacterized membrane protein YgcG
MGARHLGEVEEVARYQPQPLPEEGREQVIHALLVGLLTLVAMRTANSAGAADTALRRREAGDEASGQTFTRLAKWETSFLGGEGASGAGGGSSSTLSVRR